MKVKSYKYSAVHSKVKLMREYYYDADIGLKTCYARNQVTFESVDKLIGHLSLGLESFFKLCQERSENGLHEFSEGACLLYGRKNIPGREQEIIAFFEKMLNKSIDSFSVDERKTLDDLLLIRKLYCEDVVAFNEFFGIRHDNPVIFLRVICHVIPEHIGRDIERPLSQIIYRPRGNTNENANKVASLALASQHTFIKPPARPIRAPLSQGNTISDEQQKLPHTPTVTFK